MVKIAQFLLFVVLLQCVAVAQTADVDEVLRRFVIALGGQQNLENIHTIVFRGTMELPDYKVSGSTAEYFKYPDHFAAITEIPGHGVTKIVYDGHEGWQIDPRNGFTQITGTDLADIRRRAHIHWDLKLREFYPDIKVVGHELVNGEDAWKLEASPDGPTYDLFFSIKSGLLIRFDTNEHASNVTSSVSISDYRQVDKVWFAFGAAQTAGPVKWTRKLTEVTFNQPIDDSIFLKPEKTTK